MTDAEHSPAADDHQKPAGIVYRFLAWVERVGNRLPDPAALFVIALAVVWITSAWLAGYEFSVPSTSGARTLQIQNQLSGESLAGFLSSMVATFTGFAPLGVVLVALLGVGVAEHTGFINALLKALLSVTKQSLLSPMLLLVAIVSHTAADAGYVLVIPLGGIIFYAAGRHPLAGIACAFAGVSGGFSANFIPSGIDPLLQGFTQQAAQIIDVNREVNPLCNWAFTSASSVLVILVGWYITDRLIEPRLRSVPVDGDEAELTTLDPNYPSGGHSTLGRCRRGGGRACRARLGSPPAPVTAAVSRRPDHRLQRAAHAVDCPAHLHPLFCPRHRLRLRRWHRQEPS